MQSTDKGHQCKSASEYPGTLICIEIHVKMWTLHSVKGIHPFVAATLAVVENNPVISLLCAIINSVCPSEDVTWVGGHGEGWGEGGLH